MPDGDNFAVRCHVYWSGSAGTEAVFWFAGRGVVAEPFLKVTYLVFSVIFEEYVHDFDHVNHLLAS